MGYLHTELLGTDEREVVNNAIGGRGGLLDTDDYRSLAAYLNVSEGTVRTWHQPATGGRLIRVSAVPGRVCNADGDNLQRWLYGICSAIPGGLERLPLYTGKEYGLTQRTNTVGEALSWVDDLYNGDPGLVNLVGFRLNKAWTRIEIWAGGDTRWRVEVTYNGMDPDDDSDPDEPCGEEDE